MPSVSIKINGVAIDHYVLNAEVPVISRERDYQPKASGFTLSIKDCIPTAPVKNDLVELFVDGDEKYLGFISDFERDYEGRSYEIEVTNYLMKLAEKLIDFETVHYLLGDTSDWSDERTFTVNTGTDEILDAGHSLVAGDRVIFRTTGTLPAPLRAGHYYFVSSVDANGFYLEEGYWFGRDPVDLTSSGSGTHYYSNNMNYNLYSDLNIGKPNVAIKWLVEKLFEDCGMTLDSSNVDSQVLFNRTIDSVNYTFNWTELCFDENMLFALNQNEAINFLDIDDSSAELDYYKNKITYWDLIKYLFSCFGFSIRYVGNSTTKTFELNGQSRNASTGYPTPASETLYSITNPKKYSYSSKLIYGDQGGHSFAANYAETTAYPRGATPSAISEYQKTKTGAGETTIETINNLRILLRDKSVGADDGDLFDTTIAEANEFLYGNLLYNKVSALQFNFQREEILTEIKLSNNTITEETIVITEDAIGSFIVQEENLLTSG